MPPASDAASGLTKFSFGMLQSVCLLLLDTAVSSHFWTGFGQSKARVINLIAKTHRKTGELKEKQEKDFKI